MEEFTPDGPESNLRPEAGYNFVTLTPDERTWGMLCHLSSLIAIALGGMTFLGPLICWLIKKDTSKWIDEQGKSALNFQLNVLIYALIAGVVAFVTCGIGIPLLIVVGLYGMLMPVVGAVKANNGERWEYPGVIKFFT